jgi:hypothetical protein
MRRKSPSPVGPVSTHSSIHLLVSSDALPSIRVNQSQLADARGLSTVYLHVEAEHRTARFDHTATFTVSGPDAVIRQFLRDCQTALDQLAAREFRNPDAEGCE